MWSSRIWTFAGRSPVAFEPDTPVPTWLIESDITPTFTPAGGPERPGGRPVCAASPAEVTAPTSVPPVSCPASSVPHAVTGEIARVTWSSATARPARRQASPDQRATGAASDVP